MPLFGAKSLRRPHPEREEPAPRDSTLHRQLEEAMGRARRDRERVEHRLFALRVGTEIVAGAALVITVLFFRDVVLPVGEVVASVPDAIGRSAVHRVRETPVEHRIAGDAIALRTD